MQNDKVATQEDIYGARRDGWPGYVAISIVEVPPSAEDAKTFAEWRKLGYKAERCADREIAIVGFQEYAAEKKRRAERANPPQDGLFT